MKRFLPGLPLFFTLSSLLAQDDSPTPDAAESAAASLAALGCGVVPCLIGLAISIALAIFVYRDAKARGMDNAVLLTVVTVITGILGLILYLLMRPKGNLVPCASCGQKRLEGSTKCPHCGNP
jgi:ABC-type tungstate transport system substrate-binding protein